MRFLIALAAGALIATGATAKPAPHKPAAAKPAAAAPAHPAPTGPTADGSDPATLIAILQAAGAKAEVSKKEADTVLVIVTSRFANFSVQFAQCGPDGRGCKAALLDSQVGGVPSLAQLNGFNQASAMCRGYIDKNGKAHVVMSLLLFADDTREHLVTNLAAWQGCIAEFTSFAKDPVAYLANAP
jgi:hypothetical protein